MTDARSEDEDEALQLNAMSNQHEWIGGLEAWSPLGGLEYLSTESSIYILESAYVPNPAGGRYRRRMDTECLGHLHRYLGTMYIQDILYI